MNNIPEKKFDKSLFLKAFEQKDTENKPYIGVLGVRVSGMLEQMIRENIQMNVENLTCTGGRRLAVIPEDLQKMEEEAMFLAYADTLLCQMPCFRMNNSTQQKPAVSGSVFKKESFIIQLSFVIITDLNMQVLKRTSKFR